MNAPDELPMIEYRRQVLARRRADAVWGAFALAFLCLTAALLLLVAFLGDAS